VTLRRLTGPALLAAYIATIPAANLLVEHVGMAPVGFGLLAPAGVYAVGVALVLRDAVREWAGLSASLFAIAVGTILSWFLATPLLAMASASAFLLSELLDTAVYEPLRNRGRLLAVAASNAVGLAVDSVVFLWLAFGNFDYLPGQLLGKAWMTLAAVAVITVIARRRTQVAA
jgi:uncharacterized PurR-regulated membrane protein YhhQ (DUF165 family)